MSYGIKIRNSSGDIILDDTYKNFAKYASGTTSLSQGLNTISFPATTQIPLIALRPEVGKETVLWGYRKTGSNWDGFYVFGITGILGNIDWIVYLAHPAASAEIYGMRTYDINGNLLFDSGNEYFNIYQINTGISLSTPTKIDEASGTYYNITHSGISNPYYFASPNGFWAWSEQSGEFYAAYHWKIGIKKIDATSGRIKWSLIITIPDVPAGPEDHGFNPNLNFVVLK